MIMSQPVGIGRLIMAKALARGVTLLLPSTAIMVWVAVWAGVQDPLDLLALAFTILLYAGFWLAVAVVISFVARRSTEAAIASGAVWVIIVVMAPSLTLTAVDLIAPPPSEMLFSAALKQRETEVASVQRATSAANLTPAATLQVRMFDRMRAQLADRIAADQALAPLIAAHQRTSDARRHLLDALRFGLPSVAVQDALDRIAGTDADRALAFQQQALTFRAERQRAAAERMEQQAPLTLIEFDRQPVFRFRELASAQRAGLFADLAALGVALCLLLIAGQILRRHAATP